MAQALADFRAPIVGQPIRGFEGDVNTRDFSVLGDQERLGTTKVSGALGPDFADASHPHGYHLKRHSIIVLKYVNICVHNYHTDRIGPTGNLDTLIRRKLTRYILTPKSQSWTA